MWARGTNPLFALDPQITYVFQCNAFYRNKKINSLLLHSVPDCELFGTGAERCKIHVAECLFSDSLGEERKL